MLKVINKLKLISNNISKYISDNNKLCVTRTRDNNIYDVVLYKLYYTKKNTTQEDATIKVNKHKNGKSTSRQSLAKKEALLDVDFYKNLSEKMCAETKKYIVDDKYTKQIISVDGTYPTFLNSLSECGYKSNLNENSVTPLITGLFNVTYNYPVMLSMTKHKNERKAFMDLVKNTSKYKNNIFVFDRGYVSNDLFKFMNDHELSYICRLRSNSLLISNDKDDNIIHSSDNNSVRVIRYTISDANYYIATNLMDRNEYTVNKLKSIYNDRWTIEEYFKYVKSLMNLKKMNEKKETQIKKTIYCQLIVSHITYIFNDLNKTNKNLQTVRKINKSQLTKGLYEDILHLFFTGRKLTTYSLLRLFKTHVKYLTYTLNRNNPRICKRSNFLSYFKNMLRNPKSTDDK